MVDYVVYRDYGVYVVDPLEDFENYDPTTKKSFEIVAKIKGEEIDWDNFDVIYDIKNNSLMSINIFTREEKKIS